jgi:CheY-like chemotaxis protein
MARILVVEDEPLVRELAFEDLSEAGFEVIAARDGDEALEILGQDRGFDLLFTDIKMPSAIDGWDLAEQCKALVPGIKVIFATGLSDDYGRMGPGDRFLQKPYRREALLKMLEELGIA